VQAGIKQSMMQPLPEGFEHATWLVAGQSSTGSLMNQLIHAYI
jgi:hypothetical protein